MLCLRVEHLLMHLLLLLAYCICWRLTFIDLLPLLVAPKNCCVVVACAFCSRVMSWFIQFYRDTCIQIHLYRVSVSFNVSCGIWFLLMAYTHNFTEMVRLLTAPVWYCLSCFLFLVLYRIITLTYHTCSSNMSVFH